MGLSKEHKAELDAALSNHSDIFKNARESGERMTPLVEDMFNEMELIRQKYIDEQWEVNEHWETIRLQKEAEGKEFLGYDPCSFEPVYED